MSFKVHSNPVGITNLCSYSSAFLQLWVFLIVAHSFSISPLRTNSFVFPLEMASGEDALLLHDGES